jgi:hypothetical protein
MLRQQYLIFVLNATSAESLRKLMHERTNVLIDQVIVSPTPTALYTNVNEICAMIERRGIS